MPMLRGWCCGTVLQGRLKINYERAILCVQIDFVENYSCSENQEIQSGYYSKDQIAIHPAVFHFRRDENCTLLVKSVVFVSDITDHTAAMVFAMLKGINKVAHGITDNMVQYIHYLSDSLSSQYRKCHIF